MTNEELAVKIQAGERELLPQLWQQTVKLVELWATRYRTLESRFAHFDRQDFIQCGYIALEDAIKAFDPRKNVKLNTYLARKFTDQIYKMAGIRKVTQADGSRKRVFHVDNISLDQPLTDEKDGADYSHFFMDSGLGTEKRYEQKELQQALSSAIACLREREQTVIIAVYYMDMTRADLARRLNLSKQQLQRTEEKALKQMRKDKTLCDLYYTCYYVPKTPAYNRFTVEKTVVANALGGLLNGF